MMPAAWTGAAWLLAALAAALALTLVLAARLTPGRWWRRPNLRALAVLGGGTLAFGALFATLFPTPVAPFAAEPAAQAAAAAAPTAAVSEPGPAAGAAYRVVDELNLRSERGVRGRRVAVLTAGTLVAATGTAQGDWWEVRATVDGRPVTGWASSLWLRRADEARRSRP